MVSMGRSRGLAEALSNLIGGSHMHELDLWKELPASGDVGSVIEAGDLP
jgi:hypothetical protein